MAACADYCCTAQRCEVSLGVAVLAQKDKTDYSRAGVEAHACTHAPLCWAELTQNCCPNLEDRVPNACIWSERMLTLGGKNLGMSGLSEPISQSSTTALLPD